MECNAVEWNGMDRWISHFRDQLKKSVSNIIKKKQESENVGPAKMSACGRPFLASKNGAGHFWPGKHGEGQKTKIRNRFFI